MSNKTFYRNNDVDAIRKIVDDMVKYIPAEGFVKTVSGSTAQVQMSGSANLQPAHIMKNLTVEANDRVIMIRAPRTGRWTIIGSYVASQGAGNTSSGVKGTKALAPTGLSIIALPDLFLLRWTVGVDAPNVFELEIADDTAETNAVSLIVATSTVPWAVVGTKYFRVRSITPSFEVSGWTAWASGTTPAVWPLNRGGTNADLSATGPGLIKQDTAGGNLGNLVCKFNGTAAPGVGNDNTQGYSADSLWFDTTNQKAYICFDASTGAAAWKEITNITSSVYYQTIQNAGTPLTQRGKIDFVNATSITDDAGGDRTIVTLPTGGGGGTPTEYILIRDEKAQGTDGGAFTSGAWRTRTLNTIVADDTGLVSLASNQITLPAGTYRARISVPGFYCDSHQARLQNATDATTILIGTSENAGRGPGGYNGVQTRSIIEGQFTIGASKALEVQHQCATSQVTNGLGLGANFATEVYTIVELEKV